MAIQGISLVHSETGDPTLYGVRYTENGAEKLITPTLRLAEALEAIGNIVTTGRLFYTKCFIMQDGEKVPVDVQSHECLVKEYFIRPTSCIAGEWQKMPESAILFEEVPL